MGRKMFKKRLLLGLLGIVVLLLKGCSTNPVTGKQNFVTMSESQEIKLGNRYHTEIIKQYPLYNNPE